MRKKAIKNIITKAAVFTLLAGLSLQSPLSIMAGTWKKDAVGWSFFNDEGKKESNRWLLDNGYWYLIDASGYIKTGWQLVNNKWYFLSNGTVTSGAPEGAALKGWQWIDGKCYFFSEKETADKPEASMYANEKTPDGFSVNNDGQWVEGGSVVNVSGKGYSTFNTNSLSTGTVSVGSGGGGGGGSSSGGGGGSSSGGSSVSVKTGSYTVYFVDEAGNILKEKTGSGTYGKTVTIEAMDIAGFTYVSGAGEKAFSKGVTSFTVTYKKNEAAKEPEEEKEILMYRFIYVDAETNEEIGASDWEETKEGNLATWKEVIPSDYELAAGNNLTRTVLEDNEEFEIYFNSKNECNFVLTAKEDGKTVFKLSGIGVEGDEISLPDYILNTYEPLSKTFFTLSDEENAFNVRVESIETATSSEMSDLVNFSLTYTDVDTKKVIRKEEGKAERGTDIEALSPKGYELISDETVFTADNDKNTFKVQVEKEDTETEDTVKVVKYKAICNTEDGKKIKEFTGSAAISLNDNIITIEHFIKGYVQSSDTLFSLSLDGDNEVTLTYTVSENKDDYREYLVYLTDISSMEVIRTDSIDTFLGAYLDFTDYEAPDGYEPIGVYPSKVRVQAENSNNKITLYFNKVKETTEETKYVNWTVKYVDYDDVTKEVLPSQTGTAPLGKFPVYFDKEFNQSDTVWRAVDNSPRTFTLKDNTDMNVFLVKFKKTGAIEREDLYRTYALRFIAEDTGCVLGVKVGEGNVGDSVTIRNSWDYYGYKDLTSYTIKSEGNTEDIVYRRNTVERPDKNEHTDDYDSYEFLALFVDQYGETVFEPVRGKVRDGDTFYIDYPETIERDGITYRADKASPYKSSDGGTEYRQYEITYTKGDSSETKLASWLQTAQEAKTAFWGTTPYRYAINLKEYSSWNDIGLYVGVAPKDSTVEINSVTVPGWNKRENAVNSFTLSDDNMVISREYDKTSDTPSTSDYEREYTISFTGDDKTEIFNSYTGKAAFARLNQTIDFYVYFPRVVVDKEGNRWRTDEVSPKCVTLRCNNDTDDNLYTINYYKIFTNPKTEFIVTNDTEVRNYMADVGTAMYDTKLHDFYLIGKDYNPSTAVVSEVLYGYGLTNYQGAIEDTFKLDGITYKVFHFRLSRAFDEETCDHKWQYTEELPGSCLVTAKTTIKCELCGEEKVVLKGALGHIDYDYDRVCDVCKTQLSISVGDSITISWDGREYYDGKTLDISFACIGTNEDGNYVLLAEDDISSDIYGEYSGLNRGYYSTSDLHAFLNDGFADGLSVKDNLILKNNELVTMLSKDEYENYKAAAGTTYLFPDGDFLLKSEEEDTVLTTTGSISVLDADSKNIRPVIYLPSSTETTGALGGAWSLDDLQARKIGDRVWLFRCVDENYEDSSATPKHLALFLCDTVIPSNYEMGFGIGETIDKEGQQETRFFGTANNNYKYSIIADWLKQNTKDTGDLVRVNVGVKTEYSGETKKGLWDRFNASDLTAYKRGTAQYYYADIFIPSVEEAISMGNYLFKFNGSDKNNAKDIVNNYRRGYFLRTPEYGTTDKVYYVDMVTGRIATTNAVAESDDDVCEVGIRPAYVVEQYD